MKQRELIERLKKAGFKLCRHGSDHDIYTRGADIEQVPRHKEIKENLARSIIRKWGL